MATKKATHKRTARRAPRKAAPRAGKGMKDSANKIWLAGLGAFALAEEEGSKLFKSLVEKGEAFEEVGREQLGKARDKMGELAETARERLDEATEEVRERAGDAWGKVEHRWDARVGSTLQKLGVPTRSEIARLTHRIEELTALVEKQAAARHLRVRHTTSKRRAPAHAQAS
jgi:poly(hydroxyalkanoate) granule-associated protein